MVGRSGVATAGNWIVDRIKTIDQWPEQDTLALVLAESRAGGGGAYNVLVDLAQMGVEYPLFAIGCVGDDGDGRYIAEDLAPRGIDTRWLQTIAGTPTSYTEVMAVAETGRRTFFHHYGANAAFGPEHLPFDQLPARVLHLAYLLLLRRLDEVGADGVSVGARVLQDAATVGLRTSLDLVSAQPERARAVVRPALPFVDQLVINELEAGALTGRRLESLGALRDAARELLEAGVRQRVIIHLAQGGYGATADGAEHWQPSLRLPDGFVVGAVGAGDAFAAGCVHALHEGWDLERSLRTAVATATACLRHPTTTGGVGLLADNQALLEAHPPLTGWA